MNTVSRLKKILLVLFVALFQINAWSQLSIRVNDSVLNVNRFKRYTTINLEISRKKDNFYGKQTLVLYDKENPSGNNKDVFFDISIYSEELGRFLYSSLPLYCTNHDIDKQIEVAEEKLERRKGKSLYNRIKIAPYETKMLSLRIRTSYFKRTLKGYNIKKKNLKLILSYDPDMFDINFLALEKFDRKNCSSCLMKFYTGTSNLINLKFVP